MIEIVSGIAGNLTTTVGFGIDDHHKQSLVADKNRV